VIACRSSLQLIRWHLQFCLFRKAVDCYFAALALRTVSRRCLPLYDLSMFQRQANSFLKIVCSLGLALIASSCGHTEASASPVEMDALMKTIHEYGLHHSGSVPSGSSTKPDETDDRYIPYINNLLAQEDFAQLEKIARQNRTGKGRLIGGYWKNHEFFLATGDLSSYGQPEDSDYRRQIDRLKKWIAAYPESIAARISLANLYSYYASFARGPGSADSVSDSQWRLVHERNALAKELLIEAARLKERDPEWYSVMQQIAQDEGWDKTQARELLGQAVAFEPGYYHFYRNYAQYLLPQWYGEPGDIQAFAEEASGRLPEPDSSILYFQIVSSLACYCRQAMEDLPHASWPKIRQGYTNLNRLFGTTNLIANRFAFVAVTFKDKPAAHEAFAAIASMDLGIWYSKVVFDNSRDWASAP
jgi:hypothetical protein